MSININRINVFKDNYIFIITSSKTPNEALVVDPGEGKATLEFLLKNELNLYGALITHHHQDHIGGLPLLKKNFPKLRIFGGKEEKKNSIYSQSEFLSDLDRVQSPVGEFLVWHIPGHTKGHLAFYFEEEGNKEGHLFCGDTLFGATCGNLFEGTVEEMFHSLNRFKTLKGEVKIWCAHEYTKMGLDYAIHLEPNNRDLKERLESVSKLLAANPLGCTLPLSITEELATNPYLRCDSKELQEKFSSLNNEFNCFKKLMELD